LPRRCCAWRGSARPAPTLPAPTASRRNAHCTRGRTPCRTVHRTLPRDIDFPRGEREEEPDYAAAGANEAQAAKDLRTQAEPVKSPALRANLNEVATGFDLISQSRLKPSVPTASKDYFAGTTA
jgi:hypothetical protein